MSEAPSKSSKRRLYGRPLIAGSSPGSSSLDRSTSAAFAFFSRRHSSTALRRSQSSACSSRRHSSPLNTGGRNGASAAEADSSDNDPEAGGGRSPSYSRSLKWKQLARKVLGNVDEEDKNELSSSGNNSSSRI